MTGKAVILVSGGSRGLGQAMVRDLLDHGHLVATFSRTESPFIQNLREWDPDRKRFYWEPLDAVNHRGLKTLVTRLYQSYGRIDGLVNNAGINRDGLLPVVSSRQIKALLAINLEATIYLTHLVSRVMLIKRRGTIVNFSSITAHRGFKGTSVYSATKAALDGLTRSLARELGRKNIRVNSVAPGFIETDLTQHMPAAQRAQVIRRTPLGRLGTVSDVVGLVRFLLSQEAGFITGQNFVVDGGLTC